MPASSKTPNSKSKAASSSQNANGASSKSGLPVWRLKAKMDRRFRSGHPWVYSNELQESPKGIEPGALVELRDAGGEFLARGYGNPSSLIAFRALSRDADNLRPDSVESIVQKLLEAGRARDTLGLSEASHRLCYGESDGIPGLVIDRYLMVGGYQVFSVQPHTAGADRICAELETILERYVGERSRHEPHKSVPWDRTAIILRRNMSVRKLEGLPEEEPAVIKSAMGLDPSASKIRILPAIPGTPGELVDFAVDLIEGQKTGFFLDQASNVQLAALKLRHLKPGQPGPLRILDICCYVGQWSTQLARELRKQGVEVEVVMADASATALDFAQANAEAQGATCKPFKTDVLKGLASLSDQSFDLVVCDPPALIKGRKDVPTGTHAYLQLNTQVFRLVRKGGAVVSCSCSALLEEEEFVRVLSKAAHRNRVPVRWIARGSQASDHPMLLEFPEGRYLKCWIGLT